MAFQVSPLFTDHAVLCRDRELRIFGTADAPVTAVLRDAAGRVLAEDTAEPADGRFLCLLPPQEARTGCTLTLDCGGGRAVFADIAIGDVYLASGQSNIELELQNADEGPACIASHDAPAVRYFNVPKQPRDTEEAEAAYRTARWVGIAPGTAADMSAAAYFFAMKMHDKLGVPVGIIDCYWGGTSITCWMDEDTLRSLSEGQRYLAEYEAAAHGKSMETYLAEEAVFNEGMDRWNRAAADLKRQEPGISGEEINARLGPAPWNPPAGPGSPFRPCGLHRTMLRRVMPCALTGVLFYQGEEDTARTEHYDQLLAAYVLKLRQWFRDETLPFLNVQLPMWIAAGAADSFTWPRLRLQQQYVRDQLRHTGLVIQLDQGEYDNIHPTAKRVVGERLADEALRVIYGQEDAPQAPRAVRAVREGGALRITLTAPVRLRGEGPALLEIAGQDGVWYPADLQSEGRSLLLSHPAVPRPISARYAWTDYAGVRLFGENGLPLEMFLF